jgi:hypothetical protein
MDRKKTTQKKWLSLMTFFEWDGISNWHIVDPRFADQAIPACEDWVRKNLKHIKDQDARRCFKAFFWPSNTDNKFTAHDYHLKTYGQHALGGAYSKERDNGN